MVCFANTYYQDFEKEKLIWGLIAGNWKFTYDDKGYFLTSASFFLTSTAYPIKFLLALFNSELFQFFFKNEGEYTAGGAYVLKKTSIEKFIIPEQTVDYSVFENLVDTILQSKNTDKQIDTKPIEQQLNDKIYTLFDITPEERIIIKDTISK